MPQLYCKEFASCTYGSFFYGNTYDVTDEVAKALLDEFPGRFDVIGAEPASEPEEEPAGLPLDDTKVKATGIVRNRPKKGDKSNE